MPVSNMPSGFRTWLAVMPVLLLVACSTPKPSAEVPSTAAGPVQAGRPADISGRRLVVRNGTNYYCKRQNVTGTRLRSADQCLTREQLEQQQDSVRDFFSAAESHTTPPREQ